MNDADKFESLLGDWESGNENALARLIPLVYKELRKKAHGRKRRGFQDDSIQSTELVHEAFCKLNKMTKLKLDTKEALIGNATIVMKQILLDRADARNTLKRGGGVRPEPLEENTPEFHGTVGGVDVADLYEALNKLAVSDPRAHRLIELRFFGGLDIDEAASLLGISSHTAKRDWRQAKTTLESLLKPRT